jgi:hypothetical protein
MCSLRLGRRRKRGQLAERLVELAGALKRIRLRDPIGIGGGSRNGLSSDTSDGRYCEQKNSYLAHRDTTLRRSPSGKQER